jgi:hypothetical protein
VFEITQPPLFHPIATDLKAEKRFLSQKSPAARLPHRCENRRARIDHVHGVCA